MTEHSLTTIFLQNSKLLPIHTHHCRL